LSDAIIKGNRAVAPAAQFLAKRLFIELRRLADVLRRNFNVTDFAIAECWCHKNLVRFAEEKLHGCILKQRHLLLQAAPQQAKNETRFAQSKLCIF
jgi:hypothetical protein